MPASAWIGLFSADREEIKGNMIVLTRMNGDPFVLNCDLIEAVTEQPDTRISLTNGNMYMVRARHSAISFMVALIKVV